MRFGGVGIHSSSMLSAYLAAAAAAAAAAQVSFPEAERKAAEEQHDDDSKPISKPATGRVLGLLRRCGPLAKPTTRRV